MSILTKFKQHCEDPNWVTEHLYLKPFQNQEMRNQLTTLVSEGYLQHTPLLLYLSHLIEERFKSKVTVHGSSISNAGSARKILKSRCVSRFDFEDDKNSHSVEDDSLMCDSPVNTNQDTKDTISNEVDLNYALTRLAQLVKSFGSCKRVKESHIAKKILFESKQDVNILLKDFDVLEMEFYFAISNGKKKEKRCRSKTRKRGGRKNRKKTIIDN